MCVVYNVIAKCKCLVRVFISEQQTTTNATATAFAIPGQLTVLAASRFVCGRPLFDSQMLILDKTFDTNRCSECENVDFR